MSSFLISSAPLVGPRWLAALGFSPAAHGSTLAWGSLNLVVSRVDDDRLWAPAQDAGGQVSLVLAGRLALDPEDWQRAGALPHAGGWAARWLLDAWREAPQDFPNRLNGALCVLIYEHRLGRLHLFTDRMGAFPVYATAQGEVRLASHPDVLADLVGEERGTLPLDRTTLAECLANGYGVQPFTYHEGIVQLDAASHYVWDVAAGRAGWRKAASCWQPAYEAAATRSRGELAESLAQALQRAGRRRSPEILGRQGLLLSGGADSRALLFSAAQPAAVESFTFCDRDNPEVATARQIVRAAGAPHHVLQRSPEHYGEGAWETVRVTGGMWCIKDCHFHGFAGVLAEAGLGNLMTGCYTDYLLKGLGYNKRPRRFLGRPLPLDTLADFDYDYYQPRSPIAAPWAARVQARLEAWTGPVDKAAYRRNPSSIEDLRVRPLAREADAMGRLYLLRTQPWDPVMVDNDILAFYGAIPPELKLNARVFRDAVARVTPASARHIRNNNDQSPLDAPEWLRVLRYTLRKAALWGGKRLGVVGQEAGISTDGSWPDFVYYVAHSKVLPELWESPTPGQRELLTDLLGEDPWRTPLSAWARRDVDLILRLLTLRIWLTQRGI